MPIGTRGKNERKPAGRPRSGPGSVLAAIAVLLQIIAVPILHRPGVLRPDIDSSDLSAAFDEHVLCLSEGRGASDAPSDQTPKPVHHNSVLCCFWHGNTALAPAPCIKLELVEFALPRSIFAPETRAPARRLTGAIGARAPPPA